MWLNDGGQFTDSGQRLGNYLSNEVALGDLDRDGDLDAFVVSGGDGDRVWLNNGDGTFASNGQVLGDHRSVEVSLGDLDGDGDLDAFVTNFEQGNRVWINDGGQFTDSEQTLGSYRSREVELGDLDGDGDLDAFVTNDSDGNRVWLNEEGVFTNSKQVLGDHVSFGIAIGDLDADGDLDAFVASYDQNQVWLNGNFPSVTLAVNTTTIPEAEGVSMLTASLSEASDKEVTVDLGFAGNAVLTDDYVVSATQLIFPAGATTASITLTAVPDTLAELNETIVVDITAVTNGKEQDTQTQTITDDDGAAALRVTSLEATGTGFASKFSADLDTSVLNLGDQFGELGSPDLVVTGNSSGIVAGSVVYDPALASITFISSGGSLAPDTYTVVMRSDEVGFRDTAGNLLDGDGDQHVGDDFSGAFTVTPPVPNTVRGAVALRLNACSTVT